MPAFRLGKEQLSGGADFKNAAPAFN